MNPHAPIGRPACDDPATGAGPAARSGRRGRRASIKSPGLRAYDPARIGAFVAIKVGINGFGRIGRNIMRAALEKKADIDFVAVNDLTDAKTLAHLFKYDSILGNLDQAIEARDGGIAVGKDFFKVVSQRDPAQLPWKELGVDVVFEGTGLFTKKEDAAKHIAGGRQARDHHRAGHRPGRQLRDGRQPRDLRSGEARRDLERVVHDQLSRPVRQGAARELRHHQGLDDDHPLLHQRPAAPRPPAQGHPPRPRRRAVADPDDDRRRQGRR